MSARRWFLPLASNVPWASTVSGGGNINVVAGGDVNVDGSRIAAYDGGNVFVESLRGNVNAGTGGSGSVLVSKPYLTKNGQVQELNDVIPGSGVLAVRVSSN